MFVCEKKAAGWGLNPTNRRPDKPKNRLVQTQKSRFQQKYYGRVSSTIFRGIQMLKMTSKTILVAFFTVFLWISTAEGSLFARLRDPFFFLRGFLSTAVSGFEKNLQ
jgi:hypothetical protein